MPNTRADLTALQVATHQLIAALDAHDADTILNAALAVHDATHAISRHGAWYPVTEYPAAGYHDAENVTLAQLKQASQMIEAARLRVIFLTDYSARRASQLTQAAALRTGYARAPSRLHA